VDVVAIIHDGKAIRCSICGAVVEFHQRHKVLAAFE
jgi:hypothetical protein